jgi:hypothetical protein
MMSSPEAIDARMDTGQARISTMCYKLLRNRSLTCLVTGQPALDLASRLISHKTCNFRVILRQDQGRDSPNLIFCRQI